VSAAANTAIENHFDAVADGGDYLRQYVDRCGCTVELSAAVIRDYYRGRTGVGGATRIIGVHHAFDCEGSAPQRDHGAHFVPAHGAIELFVQVLSIRRQPRARRAIGEIGHRQ
jgi:hypothetical protein